MTRTYSHLLMNLSLETLMFIIRPDSSVLVDNGPDDLCYDFSVS